MESPPCLLYPFALRRDHDAFGTRHKLPRAAAFAYELFQLIG